MKLLYLEDDTSFARRFHGELLSYRAVQWNLLHCRFLSEALERLSEDSYDAVLCDITNGDRSAPSLIARLANVAEVSLVAYGDTSDPQLALGCVELGACDYLDKYTLNGPQVMLRIRMAVERRARYCRQPPLLPDRATVPADAAERGTRAQAAAAPSDSSWRVSPDRWLVIDDDLEFTERLQQAIGEEIELVRRGDLDHLQSLATQRWQAVVLDTSEGSTRGLDVLPDVVQAFDEQPVLVISVHDDESTAIHAIQHGADDYLVKTHLSAARLREAVALAQARRQRFATEQRARLEQGVVDRRQSPRGKDRRVAARYLLTRPVLVIPMLPNQFPDASGQTEAVTVDISTTGLSLLIPQTERLPSRHWVVGIEAENQRLHYASCELRNVALSQEGPRLGLRFLFGERDLLSEENLVPQLDPLTYRLETKYDPAALSRWEELGVMVHRPWNRVKACPDCQAVVATSSGCRECGSPHLRPTQLIHHFACAYIGFLDDFDQQGQVVCPKCRTKSLVIGADYEMLEGPYHCQECGYQGTERVLAANCLACELRFPLERAVDLDLMAYDVERLDTLAFLDAAR